MLADNVLLLVGGFWFGVANTLLVVWLLGQTKPRAEARVTDPWRPAYTPSVLAERPVIKMLARLGPPEMEHGRSCGCEACLDLVKKGTRRGG
jgi:hypothetical protein